MEYHVVVVDDEPLSLTNARNILNEQGMKVSCLRSREDLLCFLIKNTPDLILLDILMPEMTALKPIVLCENTKSRWKDLRHR